MFYLMKQSRYLYFVLFLHVSLVVLHCILRICLPPLRGYKIVEKKNENNDNDESSLRGNYMKLRIIKKSDSETAKNWNLKEGKLSSLRSKRRTNYRENGTSESIFQDGVNLMVSSSRTRPYFNEVVRYGKHDAITMMHLSTINDS